jgi:hypothetical protein
VEPNPGKTYRGSVKQRPDQVIEVSQREYDDLRAQGLWIDAEGDSQEPGDGVPIAERLRVPEPTQPVQPLEGGRVLHPQPELEQGERSPAEESSGPEVKAVDDAGQVPGSDAAVSEPDVKRRTNSKRNGGE